MRKQPRVVWEIAAVLVLFAIAAFIDDYDNVLKMMVLNVERMI